jgi:DNA invertase Pin-like site-specific DNA recombinase
VIALEPYDKGLLGTTLRYLLSFAQFERELIGERVRDKIAASKRKGLWVGGPVPLGYAAIDKKIVVVATEAETVRTIYERYLALGSVRALAADLDRRGIPTAWAVSLACTASNRWRSRIGAWSPRWTSPR